MPKKLQAKEMEQTCNKLIQSATKITIDRHRAAQLQLQQILRIYPQFANANYLYSICLKINGCPKYQEYKNKACASNLFYYQKFQQKPDKIIEDIIRNMKAVLVHLHEIQKATGNQWATITDIPLKKHDFDTSIMFLKLFQRVKLPIDQYSDQTWSNIGVRYFQLGFYQQSIDMHQIAISLTPNDVLYYNNLASLNYLIGNYEKSLLFLQKTLQLEPDRTKSFYLQSFVYAKTGRIKQSLKKVYYACRKQPDQLLIRTKLLLILLQNFPERQEQINKNIQYGLKSIENGKIGKFYFSHKESFKQYYKFIQQYYKNHKNYQQKWKQYLELFSNFLMIGLKHKIGIKKKMDELSQSIRIFNKMKQKKVGSQMSIDHYCDLLPDDIFVVQ